MKLINNEEITISANSDEVVLTNYRVYQSSKEWGKSFRLSIFLEDISSIETRYQSDIYLIIIGFIIALLGLTQIGNSPGGGINYIPVIGIVIGVIFLAIWLASRKNIIKISSNGGSALNCQVENMSDEAIEDFIILVLNAKLDRINQLNNQEINKKKT